MNSPRKGYKRITLDHHLFGIWNLIKPEIKWILKLIWLTRENKKIMVKNIMQQSYIGHQVKKKQFIEKENKVKNYSLYSLKWTCGTPTKYFTSVLYTPDAEPSWASCLLLEDKIIIIFCRENIICNDFTYLWWQINKKSPPLHLLLPQ